MRSLTFKSFLASNWCEYLLWKQSLSVNIPLKWFSGSCVGECGFDDGVCYCDTDCVMIGDCCDDYSDICPSQYKSSCYRAHTKYNAKVMFSESLLTGGVVLNQGVVSQNALQLVYISIMHCSLPVVNLLTRCRKEELDAPAYIVKLQGILGYYPPSHTTPTPSGMSTLSTIEIQIALLFHLRSCLPVIDSNHLAAAFTYRPINLN